MRRRSLRFVAAVGILYMFGLLTTQFQGAAFAQGGKKPKEPAPQDGVNITPSKVTAVTVYSNSALVTREVEVPEGKGQTELIVSPLPSTVVPSSLFSEGSDGVRVLTTRYRTRTIQQDTREDVRKLQEEIAVLATAREKLEADVRVIQENLKTITKMEGFMGVSMIQATEKAVLNADAAIALSKYIKDSRNELSRELVGVQQQVKANLDKAASLQAKLSSLGSGVARTERDAVLAIERTKGGKVRLSYLVDSATWRPQYKLRGTKSGKEPVEIEYLAALLQNTGEDWNDVNLVLSTAQPMLNSTPPDLQSLQVTVVHKTNAVAQKSGSDLEDQIRSLRSKAQKDFNEKKQSTGIGLFNTAAALDQSFELLNPEAALKRGCALAVREGPTVTYPIKTKFMVPSRNEEQVLEIARVELTPKYYYKAVPLLTTQVYRLADLVNKSEYVILPGDATMYLGTDFVGQMSLPLVAVGEPFTVGFGVDPQLQVLRQMIDRGHSIQGGNQSLRYEFRTLVSNYKSEKVDLQVWDRVPHAETDAVSVTLSKTVPDLSKDPLYLRGQRPQNLLRWDVTVEPNAVGEKALAIKYEFKLELDRQMTINSFQSAGVFGQPATAHPLLAMPTLTGAEQARIATEMGKLSPEDRRLAQAQFFCAIDQDSPLGSMGPVLKVIVKGQPVFLCCKGCEAEAKAHPDETLLKLQNLVARMTAKR